MPKNTKSTNNNPEFEKLLNDNKYFQMPKVGDVVKGTVINASKNEVRIDINGVKTGVVRGRELYNESEEYGKLKPGDEVEATVIELENEKGEMDLSFRYAGQQKAWDYLRNLMASEEIISVKITDANKGGLMAKVGHTTGFLPVSQLIPEHYPRVEGGDKNKILEFLKKFVNQSLKVKVIDVDQKEDKLIVSEKAAWEEVQEKAVSKFKVGDKIKGKITAVTDFGAFVEFDDKMEGLIHISEIAWQRIDDPRDVVKIGDKIEAEIINIEGTKIFLSMKKLKEDPWKNIDKKYKVGDMVKGTVLKANPFGLFVELDRDIHGLAHISELSEKPVANLNEIAKSGDTLSFKIISIEPQHHRLGLSLKALKKPSPGKAKDDKEPSAKKAEEKNKKTKPEKHSVAKTAKNKEGREDAKIKIKTDKEEKPAKTKK